MRGALFKDSEKMVKAAGDWLTSQSISPEHKVFWFVFLSWFFVAIWNLLLKLETVQKGKSNADMY